MYSELENTAIVHTVDVVLGQQVSENQQIASARITSLEGTSKSFPCVLPLTGTSTTQRRLGQSIDSRLFVDEHCGGRRAIHQRHGIQSQRPDQDGILDGRSTTLSTPIRTDGLIDGIEVMGWEILVVNAVSSPLVTSTLASTTPMLMAFRLREFSSTCNLGGSNASNPDTDSDGLTDLEEAGQLHVGR